MSFADKLFSVVQNPRRDRHYFTPRGRSSTLPDSATPSPLPQPFSKRVLTAEQKMTRTLQSAGLSNEEIQRIKHAREQELQAKAALKLQKEQQKELKKKEKADKAAELKEQHRITMELRQRLAEMCPPIGEPGGEPIGLIGDGADVAPPAQAVKGKKRQGPMTEAMERFLDARKKEGIPYFQAMSLWRDSAERAAIVNAMTPSERKKRKYDLVRVPADVPAPPPAAEGERVNAGAA